MVFIGMLKKTAIVIASFVFASSVLFTSIFRTASPQYVFSQAGSVSGATDSAAPAEVDYYLPYPGMLPDHFLWPVKVLRDKLWLLVVRDPAKKAEILLLFADKRIGMARELIRGGKPDIGVGTAGKAEQYLTAAFEEEEKAAQKGADTGKFLERLANSSLKHQEVLESLMKSLSEDARPVLIKIIDSPKMVYEKTSQRLNEVNRPIPVVPSPSPSPSPTLKSKK